MIRIRAGMFLTALAAAGLFTTSARAQEAMEPVPRELAEVLLGATGPSSAVVVGRLPAGFPAALAADARVLGGVERRVGGSTAILAFAGPCDQAEAEVRARLLRDGWTQPEEPGERRGFVPAGMLTSSGTFCRAPGSILYLSATPRRGGGSYVSLYRDEREEESGSPCAARQRVVGVDDAPVPALVAPAGARQGSAGGSSSGDDYRELTTSLYVELSARELVEHYGAQLRAAGWTPAEPVAVSGSAMQPFRIRAANGRDWQGVLYASELPGTTRRDVGLRLTRLPKEDASASTGDGGPTRTVEGTVVSAPARDRARP